MKTPGVDFCVVCGKEVHKVSTDCRPVRDKLMASESSRVQGHSMSERLRDGFLMLEGNDPWSRFTDDE